MPKRSSSEQYFVCVIPHTHWDREWYGTFQQIRIRLVHVMDSLLDLLERDPSYTHFNLDGQTVILQDYLEIRPEKRDLLKKLIYERRLGVGPWYVQPDEFLVSGESLVRNLILGHRLADEFGHCQKVGYLPDIFGHISQLPQILQGFGIPYAMNFRGLDGEGLKSELWWESPDDSRVLLRHLPTDLGYSNASALSTDVAEAASDLQAFAQYEKRRASSTVLLALNGSDHLPAREDLPAILEDANRRFGNEFQFHQASLEDYFYELERSIGNQPLQVVRGELRDSNRTPGHDNRLLPHVLSSRIYNKMQNERVQNLLERWAEPWSTIAWLEGEEYPDAFLSKAWEWLLQNHAHDSIGGCSIDAVHTQMETRFAWASEIVDEITRERFELLSRQIDLSGLKEDEAALIVFNNLSWPIEEAITVDIDLWNFFLAQVAFDRWNHATINSQLTKSVDAPEIYRRRVRELWYGNHPLLPDPKFRGLRIRLLAENDPIPVQIESITRSAVLRPLVSGLASERRGVGVRASFMAKIPAYGYQVYAVTPAEKPNKAIRVSHPGNIMENGSLRIQINQNGTFNIEDKTNRQTFRDLGYFEDGGDCGDGYNYSYPLEDRVENTLCSAPVISCLDNGPVVQRLSIDYDLTLPARLDYQRRKRIRERIPCPLRVILSLKQGSPRLDIEVIFGNHICDHRLRMIFPSDVKTLVSQASAQFDVVTRQIKVVPVPAEAWVEDAPSTFPQQDWVDLSDGERGFCVISRGLPEYEVIDNDRREIAITLLRAVGNLGAGTELQTAEIGGGPNIDTPDGQIQRTLTYSISILPHKGTWDQAEVWRQALAFNNPPRAYTTGMDRNQPGIVHGNGISSRSMLSVEGKNVIVSALKKAEDNETLILRLFNPSENTSQAIIHLSFTPMQAQLAGLDEKPLKTIEKEIQPIIEPDNVVKVIMQPKKIITLMIE